MPTCRRWRSGDPIGETRVRIGEEITIISDGALADRLYVRLGTLEPIRVTPRATAGFASLFPMPRIRSILDHTAPRPIPPAAHCRPGPSRFSSSPSIPSRASTAALARARPSPDRAVTRRTCGCCSLHRAYRRRSRRPGNAATILRVTGNRLWHPEARIVEVIVGDAAIPVRAPGGGDPWAAPTPTAVEVPMSAAAELLDISATPYPVAVQVDGARSRDTGVPFTWGHSPWRRTKEKDHHSAKLRWPDPSWSQDNARGHHARPRLGRRAGCGVRPPGHWRARRRLSAARANACVRAGLPAAIDRAVGVVPALPFRRRPVCFSRLLRNCTARPKQITPQRAQTILGLHTDEARQRHGSGLRPTRRCGAFSSSKARNARLSRTALLIDERIGRYLMGDDATDHRLAGHCGIGQCRSLPQAAS